MQVLCKLLFYTTGVYDLLYSAVHPMKYLESDVMYSVPHYKTGFLIFGHLVLVDYLQNHACYKHTQYIKMITVLY